jgi:hypothetical protein
MPRSAVLFVASCALGMAALLFTGLVEQRSEAFTLGVAPATTVAHLGPRDTVCQRPIDVPDEFSGLRLTLAAALPPGAPVRVDVRAARDGRRLASGSARGGYGSKPVGVTVALEPVDRRERIEVCLHGSSHGGTLVFGNSGAATRESFASLNGRRVDLDVAIVFLRAEPASLLSLTGDILSRASLFHGGWVEPWMLGLLAALVLIAVPALLAAALVAASRPADQPAARAPE